MIRSMIVSFSSIWSLYRNEHITGENVTARINAPAMAKAYVLAIGPNRAPSGPVIANSGRNALPIPSFMRAVVRFGRFTLISVNSTTRPNAM